MSRFLLPIACVLLALAGSVARAANPCGIAPGDWCTTPADGACGRHMNEADCRADSACVALRYKGE